MRFSTQYGLGNTKTFRRASKKLFKRGGNAQNWEKKLRKIFISDGWTDSDVIKLEYYLKTGSLEHFNEEELSRITVFLQVDQSGAEALIVAYECRPADYRELFKCNVKPHTYVALKLFREKWYDMAIKESIDIAQEAIDELAVTKILNLKNHPNWKQLDKLIRKSDEWDASIRYYYLSKQTCHSANYGIEENTFVLNLLAKSDGIVNLPNKLGGIFLSTYRGLFPEIVERCDRIAEQARRTGILYNLFGHPYEIGMYDISDSIIKELYAWSAQSTVAEITRKAYCELYEYIKDTGKDWSVLLDCHDSYVTQCKLTEVSECASKMHEFMNQQFTSPFDGAEFRMKSECKVGFNLYDSSDKNNNTIGLTEPTWLTRT